MLSQNEIELFRTSLLGWYSHSKRDLPWRRDRDPYRVWISEVMLQQTRVAAVIPYYERFLRRFPTVEALAKAPEGDILADWAGLGYYYRARNLQKAAQQVVRQGGFPRSYKLLRELSGVGDYTAAAVASIAFNVPVPVVDGNVYRVLSRVYEDSTNIASSTARKHFTAISEQFITVEKPGDFNQAMMELGATICLPRKPQCLLCAVAAVCRARDHGTQQQFPVKMKLQKSVREERTLYWIEQNGRILLWRRPPTARLMPGFWEVPERTQLPSAEEGPVVGTFRHGITYHDYRFRVVTVSPPATLGECHWVDKGELAKLPLSTVAKKALRAIGSTSSELRARAKASAE